MIVRTTLLLSITACCFACADHESSQESDGGRMQPQVDQPHAADERPIARPEEPKDDGGKLGTIDPPDSATAALPAVDPCEGAAEGFVCNGYGFALTRLVGLGDVQLGNGYADDPRAGFVPEKLVRKACVQIEESQVRRGWRRAFVSTSGDDASPRQLSAVLDLSDAALRETTLELASYAEHARESATVSTFSDAERQDGPWQVYDPSGPWPVSPEGCGSAYVWSVSTAAAVGVIVELTFPSATSRDTFVAAVGVGGLREGLVGSAEFSTRAIAAAAQTGAYVKLHVACSAGIADEMNALLRSSTCSALNFSSCRETYESVRALFAGHLSQDDPEIWETVSVSIAVF